MYKSKNSIKLERYIDPRERYILLARHYVNYSKLSSKASLFALYSQMKEDNVDIKNTLFPKTIIHMGHQARMLSKL